MPDSDNNDNGNRRALIVGGSMAGMFAALLLRRHGWRVDVFERSGEAMASRGAGLATHPELADALTAAGIDPDSALAVSLAGRHVIDRAGNVVESHPLPQRMTSWDLLYRRLREALPEDCYHQGTRFRELEAVAGGVRATFDDGRVETGDLLIGADGVQSEVRERVLPEVRPTYAGYVAWRGLVPEAAVSEATRGALAEHIIFSLPPGEQTLSYPIAGEGDGEQAKARRLNWVWYRQARSAAEQDALLTGLDGKRRAVSIPPRQMRAEAIATMRADAEERLPPQHTELIRLTDHPFLQGIFDLQCPEMVFGRTLLLGDAAFVARPHTGYGVTKAAEDAVALAHCLAAAGDDIDSGLAEWGALRLAAGRQTVERGRLLGSLLDADRDATGGDSFGLGRNVASAVLVETAISGSMAATSRAVAR